MQVSEVIDHPPVLPQAGSAVVLTRKSGTIGVTVRLDPPRYDRLKRLVQRLSTSGQSIIRTALDRSMVSLERQRAPVLETEGQSSLFAPAPPEGESPRRPRQDSFAFVRPEPTVALTYRATVPMHRWLHRRSVETGQTVQEIITGALKAARGPN